MNGIPELSSPEVLEKRAELGKRFNVPEDIHPDDLLYRFFRNQTPGVESVVRYFESGFGDANQIAYTMRAVLPAVERPKVLDFASGFGRVSRHVAQTAPTADFTAADIHAPAVEFARTHLGLRSFKSDGWPKNVEIEKGHYDFIFTLSFFSHLPDETFADWLNLLYSALKEGGCLLFTTHGEASMKIYKHLADLYDPTTGCGYGLASDQPDIEGETYGTACTDFDYVLGKIKTTGAKMVAFRSAGWWGHQDEWIIRKPPAA